MNEFKIIKIAFFWKSLRCHLNSKWNLHRKNLYILSHISYIKSIHCKYMAYNQLFFPCNNISILVMHTAIITGMGKNVTWNTRFLKVFLHVQSFKEIVWLIDQGKSAVRLFFRCLPGARCVKIMRVCLQKEDTNSGSLSREIRWLYLIIVIHFCKRY